MKQYKYKINGNLYSVTVNDIEDNVAHVEVNGTPYNVELDKPIKTAPKPITRPAAAPKTATGAPVVNINSSSPTRWNIIHSSIIYSSFIIPTSKYSSNSFD